ncbi:3-beta-hydroxysteroid sulfotransferase-like [Callorhinchus milii]|uniref:Sulfotransferase n=1 Tax=Callorhinchus milii TaxID=7868 RepID=K4GBM1_CALMI|nr:3-beta-hydroxysteroid sulfotransferase-like [Callorhinchus milii]AFM90714.1 amine sulfotransferase [Callorhinchus milii]AFM90719.1 amine sulfotransferase [Callorhinchus milii]|eukprot:gi/632972015/ref/XP_007902452.1/ PREDICTED: 3-beta-hydroxysteroid sulfotransferase-like [Callorhinchus milii]
MAENITTKTDFQEFLHNGIRFVSPIHSVEQLDWANEYKVLQDDVFIITYPKSGTTWMQQVASLILGNNDIDSVKNKSVYERAPWVEDCLFQRRLDSQTEPQLLTTHLNYQMSPNALKHNVGKVIYVARNPKDVIVSSYYFHIYSQFLKTPENFEQFLKQFVEGNVLYGPWFDHVRDWYSHKDEPNMLFVTFEEMFKDVRGVIEKVANFLGKQLDGKSVDSIISCCTFKSMKENPATNYQWVSRTIFDHNRGTFLRKGTVGDWKNHFLVAQNEWFDSICKERMADIPVKFYWDIPDLLSS